MVNGFSIMPTVTRAVAPASKFPWLLSLGSVELRLLTFWSCDQVDAKYGEVAMTVRM